MEATPGTFDSAALIVTGQDAQLIVGTDKVTVRVSAKAGPVAKTARTKSAVFISTSIEQWGDKRKSKNDDEEDHPHHENSFLGMLALWRGTGAIVLAHRCAPYLAPGHEEGQAGYRKEDGLVLLEGSELPDPGA